MTDRKRQKLLSGGENGNGDRLALLAELNYTFDPRGYFGKDTTFVKRTQLYDVWLWKKLPLGWKNPAVLLGVEICPIEMA